MIVSSAGNGLILVFRACDWSNCMWTNVNVTLQMPRDRTKPIRCSRCPGSLRRKVTNQGRSGKASRQLLQLQFTACWRYEFCFVEFLTRMDHIPLEQSEDSPPVSPGIKISRDTPSRVVYKRTIVIAAVVILVLVILLIVLGALLGVERAKRKGKFELSIC